MSGLGDGRYADPILQGRSRDISVGRQADYLVGTMREQGIDRAVLVGHDLGGGVVHIAAVRHPELCSGLVLVNSVGSDSWPIPSVTTTARTRESIAIHRKPYEYPDYTTGSLRDGSSSTGGMDPMPPASQPPLQPVGPVVPMES